MRARAFSLLEVMVAVALLGGVLTVVLSAQGGISARNKLAASSGTAITLARCKMTELEEKLMKKGFPEIDDIDTEAHCCEDGDVSGFTCDSRVEKIELPPANDMGGADGGFGMPAASGGSMVQLPGALGSAASDMMNNAGGPGGGGAGLNLDIDAGAASIGAAMSQQIGGSGGSEGMLRMVMGIVYPSLKPMLEASIRRVTVTVRWSEGPNAKEFTLVQYLTNPQRPLLGDGGMPMMPPAFSGPMPNLPPGTGGMPLTPGVTR